MIRHHKRTATLRSLLLLLLALFCAGPAPAGEAGKAGVSDLKSVYIFNFIRFTDWPEPAVGHPPAELKLQVLGDSGVLSVMQSIEDKGIAKQVGLVVDSCATNSCIRHASALFIGQGEADYPRLLAQVAGRPVLTISDTPGFATGGGMIEISYQDKKLTFIVNLQAVTRAGLYISAQLLAVGQTVGRDDE